MKKPAQKTGNRMRILQAQDLGSVSGGDNGVIFVQKALHRPDGPVTPNDNGVIHLEK